jgi:hypothetical protein
MILAAALAKLGRSHETKAAEAWEVQSNFRSSGQCAAVGAMPALATAVHSENLILLDSQRQAESSRHQGRCLRFGAAVFKSRRDLAPAREDPE